MNDLHGARATAIYHIYEADITDKSLFYYLIK